MFKSLKEKLGNVVKNFSSEVEEEKEEVKEEDLEKLEEKEKEEVEEQRYEETTDETSEEKENKSFFSGIKDTITKFTLSEEKFEDLFWELELVLLENNVGQEIIDKLKEELREDLTGEKISRKNPEEVIKDSLKHSLEKVLDQEEIKIEERISKKKPYIISLIGVNGSGKTTSLAKLAYMLKNKGYSVVVAASDTFRAAAIQQLENHTEKIGVKLIKHDYQSDPAAVAYDAYKHAEAQNIDVVLIDTAGRLHSNTNLMQELKKIVKVVKPDLKIFVGESITGNDCVEQAKTYNENVGIDGIILSKADIDEKGGAAISVSYITGKPILYIGTGQEYKDFEEFDKEKILENLGL